MMERMMERMMQRHATDFVELFFGLAFLAAGGGFIVKEVSDRTFDPAWVAAIALVTIGCAFLAATLLHHPRTQPEHSEAPDEPPES
jgi:hypothetical protein